MRNNYYTHQRVLGKSLAVTAPPGAVRFKLCAAADEEKKKGMLARKNLHFHIQSLAPRLCSNSNLMTHMEHRGEGWGCGEGSRLLSSNPMKFRISSPMDDNFIKLISMLIYSYNPLMKNDLTSRTMYIWEKWILFEVKLGQWGWSGGSMTPGAGLALYLSQCEPVCVRHILQCAVWGCPPPPLWPCLPSPRCL